jgi:hypothetical protein
MRTQRLRATATSRNQARTARTAGTWGALTILTLAGAAACGGGYTVPFEGDRGPKRAKTDVPIYDVDCQAQVNSPADCSYQGGAMGFKVLGLFRVPPKALANWGRYRVRVLETAAAMGCPAVAFRKIPPGSSDGTAIGGFCIDPASAPAGGSASAGGAGGINISVSASVTPPRIECNQPSDCPPSLKCTRGECQP